MSRSKWKIPYINRSILIDLKKKEEPYINSRASVILPSFIGKTVQIYNGLNYIKTTITKQMVGYKFGEFSPTRKKFLFKKKKHGTKNKFKYSSIKRK